MSSQPVIPIELCEVVIDFVASENATPTILSGLAPQYQLRHRHLDLVACALTCRAWLPRSAHHLSSRLFVNSQPRMEEAAELMKRDRVRALVIRTLYACSPPRPYSPEHEGRFSHWSHLLPFRMAGILPNLENLVLVDLNWRYLHPSFFLLGPKFTNTVTTLHIFGCQFDSPWKLVSILAMFPSVRDLSIAGAQFFSGRRGSVNLDQPCKAPSLRSVELKGTPDISPIISWISSLRSAASLDSLSLDVSEPMDSLLHLLSRCTALTILSLNFKPGRASLVYRPFFCMS